MKLVTGLSVLLFVSFELEAGQILEKRPEIYSLHIVSDIKYRFATTRVTSRVKNPSERSREAIFDVTLPNEAFITNLTLEIDGKIIVGEIKEKEVARQQYDAARRRGESAGYIGTKHRETNKFNLAITVAPLSKVSFNLTYQELLKRKHGFYEQVIYIDPGQPVQDMQVSVAILETREITNLLVPPLRNDVNIDITEAGEMPSVIIQQPGDNKAYVKYFPSIEEQMAISENGISGQFVVKYDVDRDMDAGDLLVVNGYFVHFFAPKGFNPIPKDVLFVLDKSGSMHGTKIVQLKEAMVSILDELNEGDRINIMTFSTSTSFWRPEMVEITGPEVIQEAALHVESINPGGWTNIEGAVTMGLAILAGRDKDPASVRSPVLVFLTDGEPTKGVTNKDAILRIVMETNVEKIPIFSLAFGQGADYDLVKKLSAQNFGFARKIYEASDADKQIAGFYKEISITLLNNVTFTYLDAPVTNVTNTEYPYYFEGSEVIVAGKMVTVELQKGLVLRSEIQANSVEGIRILQANAEIDDAGFGYNLTGVGDYEEITEKVWAYLTIKELLKKALASEDELLKEGYKKKVLELSLKYGFVTPLTSMVVTKPEVEEDVETVDDLDELEYVDEEKERAFDIGFSKMMSSDRRPVAMPSGVMHSQVAHSPPRMHAYSVQDPILPPAVQRYPVIGGGNSPPLRTFHREPANRRRIQGKGPMSKQSGGIYSKFHRRRNKMKPKKNKQRRKDRRRQRKQKKKQLKLTDFPMKVNFSEIELPVCYGLYNRAQQQNNTLMSYLIYRDPSNETTIVADITMERLNKWRHQAEIKKITFENMGTTEEITRSSFQNEVYIKRKTYYFTMYVLPSTSSVEGLTFFFDAISEDQLASGDGILAKTLSKQFSLKRVATIRPKKNKKKRKQQPQTKQPQTRGLFKIKGERNFVGVLAKLPDQRYERVGSACWDIQRHESKFFDLNESRITIP